MSQVNHHSGFLHDLAKKVLGQAGHGLGQFTIVFPNKRAGLFFRKILSGQIDAPVWAPEVISMEEFIQSHSSIKPVDKLGLLTRLYPIHKKITGMDEPFEKFFNWGEMLVSDFEDIDNYMVDAGQLFSVLKSQREIDINFGGLEQEQVEIIKRFWSHFEVKEPGQQQKFLRLWEKLHPLYMTFQESLISDGLGYQGMIYREVAAGLDDKSLKAKERPVVFAGFNALTRAEEAIILWYLQHASARVFWDADRYYLEDPKMEAGIFLRQYRDKPLFQPSFSEPFPDLIGAEGRTMNLIQCTDPVSQVKHLAGALERLSKEPGWVAEETAIVLGDESLLMPLLQSLPEGLSQVNVTMGFPLRQSYWYGWLEHLLDLQSRWKGGGYVNYRPVLNLLRHSILLDSAPDICNEVVQRIQSQNRIWVPIDWLKGHAILEQIFTPQLPEAFFEYVKSILQSLPGTDDHLKESLMINLYRHLNRLHDTLADARPGVSPTWEGLTRLMRKFFNSVRVPFTGEPLNGVQIMGVLETRNLDFKHVFFLSMNEEVFPGQPASHSYIPYNLRKAFGLPGIDHHDAIYSYLFYRLLQRGDTITCYYTSGQQNGKSSERSRYLLQMVYESGWSVIEQILNTPFQIPGTTEISISGTEKLREVLSSGQLELSPTAVQTYLTCKLKFYLEYVLRILEPDAVSEDIDGALFGQVLHKTMERLYQDFTNGQWIMEEEIKAMKKRLPQIIEMSFREEFGIEPGEPYEWEGFPVMIRDLVAHLVERILEVDLKAAPIKIIALEARNFKIKYHISIGGEIIPVTLKGIIDRIDETDTAVRIIDYKTGKDVRALADLENAFNEKNIGKNKAGFQALFYSLLYTENNKGSGDKPLQAGLYNVKEIFEDDFDFRLNYKSEQLSTSESILTEFEAQLKASVNDMLDESIPFDQTTHLNNCTYCPFKDMCGR